MRKTKDKDTLFTPAESLRSGIFTFVIALIVSLSWVFIDFFISDFWQDNTIHAAILLTITITLLYLQLVGISRWMGKASQTLSGCTTLLFFVIITIGMSYLASFVIINKTLPWAYTKFSGKPSSTIMTAEKHAFTGSKGCETFLYFEGDSERKACIAKNKDKYPDIEFKAKLNGKQSKLGFLIESIEVVKQP